MVIEDMQHWEQLGPFNINTYNLTEYELTTYTFDHNDPIFM